MALVIVYLARGDMEFIFQCSNAIQIDISRVSAQVLFCFKFMDVILIIGSYCNFSLANYGVSIINIIVKVSNLRVSV